MSHRMLRYEGNLYFYMLCLVGFFFFFQSVWRDTEKNYLQLFSSIKLLLNFLTQSTWIRPKVHVAIGLVVFLPLPMPFCKVYHSLITTYRVDFYSFSLWTCIKQGNLVVLNWNKCYDLEYRKHYHKFRKQILRQGAESLDFLPSFLQQWKCTTNNQIIERKGKN